ncbi:hypothetical protein QM012_000758 [Aureobasidium pullulans]|uniref:DUF1446-domain-containing protein n=1 Tax=Aureobasidium pullulans TaxID=5580 RepID=A0ABR0TXW3_AURPU
MTVPTTEDRWQRDRGQRPVRIGNCSGSIGDQGYQMLRQMELGDVDFVTGDYLAELNLAQNVDAYLNSKHPGYEPTAWDGLQKSMQTINAKRIKVIINGGALNPLGLAKKCRDLILQEGYDLQVAAVTGDDVLDMIRKDLGQNGALVHLDSSNDSIKPAKHLHAYLDRETHPLVSAHAYLGSRSIVKALEIGASIVICGRVADAAPVVGAARYWYKWSDTSYDELAGALIAGHLIECSAYVTGANLSGFEKYSPELLFDLPFGIAEVSQDGTCVITKHENTAGFVTENTVKSQLLYEIQGNYYLNSDVKAYLDQIIVEEVEPNRVKVHGARGAPPPPTTKVAVAYKGGYQAQLLFNLGGYAVEAKQAFYEKQIRRGLKLKGLADKFDELQFQVVGNAASDPKTLLSSTTYMRVFMTAPTQLPIFGLLGVFVDNAMQHVSGAHGSTDLRSAMPLAYLGYFPAQLEQSRLHEKVTMLGCDDEQNQELDVDHGQNFEDSEPRVSRSVSPDQQDCTIDDFGPCAEVSLGDVAFGRSGDKGSNVSLGIFVSSAATYAWLRLYLSEDRMKQLMGNDWSSDYHLERVELPNLYAVHFVIYGFLGRGVSSTSRLDSLGKGFADWIRARRCMVPTKFLQP